MKLAWHARSLTPRPRLRCFVHSLAGGSRKAEKSKVIKIKPAEREAEQVSSPPRARATELAITIKTAAVAVAACRLTAKRSNGRSHSADSK